VSKPIYLVHASEYKNWIFDPAHPTQGRRFTNSRDLLFSIAKSQSIEIVELLPRLATKTELERVHSPAYIEQVLEEHICDEWDGLRPDMSNLAALFVGGTLTALEALLAKKTKLAINFPGAKHHAQFDHASGFCIFNDFALAADIATNDHGLKVAIIDIDAHHGDGVENLTRENPNVLTFSIHEQGIFPGTGNADELENHVFNFPLSRATTGLGDSALLAGINRFIPIAHDFQPDLLFITSGADGLAEDPLTNLQYTVEGYASAARLLAKAFPDTPKLMGGAGGYLPDSGTPEVWAAVAAQISR